jgi:hypothetical protein
VHTPKSDYLELHSTDSITFPPGAYVNSIYDISRCSYELLSSSLFSKHVDYVRRQIIYGLLQVCMKDGVPGIEIILCAKDWYFDANRMTTPTRFL